MRAMFDAEMRLALAGVAALALFAAACSGGKDEPEPDQAARATASAADSARISILVTSPSADRLFDAACTGIADYARSRSRLVCDYADNTSMELIEIGNRAYVRRVSEAGTTRPWTESTAGEDVSIATSPARLLARMRAATSREERIAEEDVRGEPTVHYQLTVDREAAGLRDGPGETTVDVWLADDLLRRISYEERGARKTTEFFDFGIDVDVAAPPVAS
jgi:hypothetical protein